MACQKKRETIWFSQKAAVQCVGHSKFNYIQLSPYQQSMITFSNILLFEVFWKYAFCICLYNISLFVTQNHSGNHLTNLELTLYCHLKGWIYAVLKVFAEQTSAGIA